MEGWDRVALQLHSVPPRTHHDGHLNGPMPAVSKQGVSDTSLPPRTPPPSPLGRRHAAVEPTRLYWAWGLEPEQEVTYFPEAGTYIRLRFDRVSVRGPNPTASTVHPVRGMPRNPSTEAIGGDCA